MYNKNNYWILFIRQKLVSSAELEMHAIHIWVRHTCTVNVCFRTDRRVLIQSPETHHNFPSEGWGASELVRICDKLAKILRRHSDCNSKIAYGLLTDVLIFDNGIGLIFKQSRCVLGSRECKFIFTFDFKVCRKSNDYLYPQFTTTSGVTTNTK